MEEDIFIISAIEEKVGEYKVNINSDK